MKQFEGWGACDAGLAMKVGAKLALPLYVNPVTSGWALSRGAPALDLLIAYPLPLLLTTFALSSVTA